MVAGNHERMEAANDRAGPADGRGGGKTGRGGARRGSKAAGTGEVPASANGSPARIPLPRTPTRPHARTHAPALTAAAQGPANFFINDVLRPFYSARVVRTRGGQRFVLLTPPLTPRPMSAAGPVRGRGAGRAWRARALRGQGAPGARREGSRGRFRSRRRGGYR